MPKKSLNKTVEQVQYEVQKVLGAKFKSKCPNIRGTASEYKIRWVGFSAKWDTWEPAHNIEVCATESIDSFWEERDIAAKLKTKTESKKIVKTEVVVASIRPRRSTANKKPTDTGVAKITERLESTSIQKRGNKRGSFINNDVKSPSPKKVKTAIEQVEAKVLEIMIDTVKPVDGAVKRSSRRAKSENIGLEKSKDGELAHASAKTAAQKKVSSKGVSSKGISSKRVAANKATAKKLSEKQVEKKKKSETNKMTKTKSGLPIAFQKKSTVKKIKTKVPARKNRSKSQNTEIEFKKSQILKVVKHVLKKESYTILESVKQHVDKQIDRFQRNQEDFYTEIKTLILSCESELSDELIHDISQLVQPIVEKTAENKSDEDSVVRNISEVTEASILPVEVDVSNLNGTEDKTNSNQENIDPLKMTKAQQMELLKSQAELVEKRKSGDEQVLA